MSAAAGGPAGMSPATGVVPGAGFVSGVLAGAVAEGSDGVAGADCAAGWLGWADGDWVDGFWALEGAWGLDGSAGVVDWAASVVATAKANPASIPALIPLKAALISLPPSRTHPPP